MESKYPNESDIKVEWTKTHSLIVIIITLFVVSFLFYESRKISCTKFFSIIGLYVEIIGVVIASLKTPFYGAFYDGGQIERERQKVEKKYFQSGMYLIALGMILQVISALLQ